MIKKEIYKVKFFTLGKKNIIASLMQEHEFKSI